MAIDLNQIEAEFSRLNRGLNLDQLFEDANNLAQSRLVGSTSQLGFDPGQVVAGFESLTSAIDDVIPSVIGSAPQQLVDRPAIAQMTSNVPQIGQRLVQSVEGAANDLQQITGSAASAIDNGFLDVVVSASTPEAIAAAVGQVTDVSVDEALAITEQVVNLSLPLSESITDLQDIGENILENVPLDQIGGDVKTALRQTVGTLENTLDKVVTQSINAAAPITKQAGEIFSNISGEISATLNNVNKGFDGILSNIVDQSSGNVVQALNSIATIDNVAVSLPANVTDQVRSLVNSGDFNQATNLLSQFSDQPLDQIQDVLRGIDVSVAGNLSVPGRGGGSIPARRIGDNQSLWSEQDTPDEAFSLIVTHEELEVELKSTQREITEIIVHWTETNINQDIGAEEIQRSSADSGVGIPYHYIIRRDGSLQRGRPINEVGGPLINNHNQYSIQIAFVGGINAPSEVEEIERFLSKDSLTTEQMKTFKVFLQKSYAAWPGVQALGHNEIDRAQRDPGFDVSTYVKDVFQKESIYTDAYSQSPYNRQQITTTRLTDWDYR